MAPKQEAEPVPVKTPDPAKLADAWTSVLVNGAEAIRAATERSMVAPASAPYYLTLVAAHHLFQFYLDAQAASDPRIDLLHRDELAGLPPTLLAVGHCDILFDECLGFARKLQAAMVPLQVLTYPGFIHGFLGFSEQVPTVSNALQVIGRALAIGLDGAGSAANHQA